MTEILLAIAAVITIIVTLCWFFLFPINDTGRNDKKMSSDDDTRRIKQQRSADGGSPPKRRCTKNNDPISGYTESYDTDNSKKKDFSHPVYKGISLKNGEIHRMTHKELQEKLEELKLDKRGFPDILRKRIKTYYKHQAMIAAGLEVPLTAQKYDYLCVIDFEATCERQNDVDYVHEIIEFPIVLVDTKTLQVTDEFLSFCKPLLNPKLSKFCTELTTITQSQVDSADTFPIVMDRVQKWMSEKGLGTQYSFAVLTDGPWDMNIFLKVQCTLSDVPFPDWARQWINLSKIFSNFYKTQRLKLKKMLNGIGFEFEGTQHRGIDDARNIARIAIKLLEDGCYLEINDKLTR